MHAVAGRSRGFTMVELLVGIAILAIVLALGVPSLQQWIMSNRVAAIGSELVTDLQMARSEMSTRDQDVWVVFRTAPGLTCYTINLPLSMANPACDCRLGAGNACSGANIELKTVSVPSSLGVTIASIPPATQVRHKLLRNPEQDPNNRPALTIEVSDGGSKKVRVLASAFVQRPSLCVPSGSTIPGMKPCP